jgi:hypothetical protein
LELMEFPLEEGLKGRGGCLTATATLVVVMALMMEMMAVAKQPMTREL